MTYYSKISYLPSCILEAIEIRKKSCLRSIVSTRSIEQNKGDSSGAGPAENDEKEGGNVEARLLIFRHDLPVYIHTFVIRCS